jgi:hypothetical protein
MGGLKEESDEDEAEPGEGETDPVYRVNLLQDWNRGADVMM